MEYIISFDTYLFYLINNGLSNKIFDAFMPFITEMDNWLMIYILGFWFLFFKSGKNGRIAAIVLIITIIISDQLSSTFIKEWVGRIRPCHTLEHVNLLVGCGGGKSFPSSHAVNNFAAAFVITFYFKKYRWFFFTMAALVAISRVYVGVHYPVDILAGTLIGLVVAYCTTFVTQKILNLLSKNKTANSITKKIQKS